MAENLARAWWKATRSNGSGACVEVAVFKDGTVGVRDSKHPSGDMLQFTLTEWQAFLHSAQRAEFDI